MASTFPRNHFLEILRDPLTMTILGSIALHALLGAYLIPLITKPQPADKPVESNTVKVFELTPSEIQRIPNAPAPIPSPTPSTLPPVYQPSQPIAPTAPKVAPTKVIPPTPVRTPTPKVTTIPKTAPKDRSTPSPSTGGIFDPSAFDAVLTPQPTKTPAKKSVTVKPSPKPTPSLVTPKKPTQPAKKTATPIKSTPSVASNTDDDGGEQGTPIFQPTPIPSKTSQSSGTPTVTPRPTIPSSGTSSSSSAPASSSGGGGGFYGKYTQAAAARLRKYEQDNPGLITYRPIVLSQPYPVGVPCSRIKQPPFIVLMVAFGKVPQGQNSDILGATTAPSIDKPYVAGDSDTPNNRKLAATAANTALYEANKADQTRAQADRNKPVLYQYRVQFDSTTCKN